MPAAGSARRPVQLPPELARQRQRHVLDRLVAAGVLTAAEADRAFAQPSQLRRTP